MKTKRFISIFIALTVAVSFVAFAKPKRSSLKAQARLKIVATIFPEYDWTREILGDKAEGVELTLLLNNGVDLHSYQPTVQDIKKIKEADIFIYVGGESDEWVDDVIKTAHNEKLVAVNLLKVLGTAVKEEEIVEGMESEEEDEDEAEYDEHVWLSLRNTQIIVNAITQVLENADSANAAAYKANATAYNKKLAALDQKYIAMVKSAKRTTLLFGDRFPFRYLVDDYGLTYYAAFLGCSAETEASFKTVAFLAQKVDELSLPYVMQIETSNGKLATTIIKNSRNKKASILTLDSMQSTTALDIKKGASYIGIMQKNFEVLKTALN